MLLTITTTHRPATDLSYLLHKAPGRTHERDLAFGRASVFYTELTTRRCAAAMLLELDVARLVRKSGPDALEHYVSDRPYVASSYLAVALTRVFGTALSGTCKDRPELAEKAMSLEARISAIAASEGERKARALFEPLGYEVSVETIPLDERYPEWGESPGLRMGIKSKRTVSELLTHLYVLLPVLDGEKHYFIDETEVDKLLRYGQGWLDEHPERDWIARRYLKYRSRLVTDALERLEPARDALSEDAMTAEEESVEKPLSLAEERRDFLVNLMRASGAREVVDLGCGEGALICELARSKFIRRVVGADISNRALLRARNRVARLPEGPRNKVELLTSSLLYRDSRLAGFDAAICSEVIEHLDSERLDTFGLVVFGAIKPPLLAVTTPNREFNARFESLAPGQLRHRDHRFEWTRAEFEAWANSAAETYAYEVRFAGIGDSDPELGAPTQVAIFELKGRASKRGRTS